MKTNAIFITGTDTGVGKTVVTGLLARFLREKGVKVVTQKWVQTGCGENQGDIRTHMRLMGEEPARFKKFHSDMVPYTLKFPSSPHLAAEMEGVKIDTSRIKKSFRCLTKEFDCVLVEGTGGFMTPLNERTVMADIVEELSPKILVVAQNRLGAINQAVMTVEALRKRDLGVIGILFNRLSKGGDERVLKDNTWIVKKITGEEVLGELSHSKDKDVLYRMFCPIGEKIFEKHMDVKPRKRRTKGKK